MISVTGLGGQSGMAKTRGLAPRQAASCRVDYRFAIIFRNHIRTYDNTITIYFFGRHLATDVRTAGRARGGHGTAGNSGGLAGN